jgi:uncharacterized protein (TIGR02001 family)
MANMPKALLLAGVTSLAFATPLVHAQTAPAAPAAPESPHTFTGKLAVYSEYEYRGISQTSEKPALQLNLDYAHSSGFYLGTFLTNIKWLKDAADVGGFSTNAKIEWDIYGGYKFEPVKDWLVDVGYLRYEYPSSGSFNPKPNTDEVYAGVTYNIFTLKYSYSFNNTFGVAHSKGSDYLEASFATEVYPKLTLNGLVGRQRYKGNNGGFDNDDLSYTVYKLGVTYDFGGGFNAGAYYKGTDAEGSLYTFKGKDWSKDRLVAFVTYSF